MNLPVLQTVLVPKTEFIRFWGGKYFDKHENLYTDNIGHDLTPERLHNLFRWKNGRPLWKQQRQTVEQNFVARLSDLKVLPRDSSAAAFLNKFIRGGAIWRVFFLHIWQPDNFPIYDQHVHRAMMFIRDGVAGEIPPKDKDKINCYINEYLLFYQGFGADNYRSLDKALWVFGKYLKSPFAKSLH